MQRAFHSPFALLRHVNDKQFPKIASSQTHCATVSLPYFRQRQRDNCKRCLAFAASFGCLAHTRVVGGCNFLQLCGLRRPLLPSLLGPRLVSSAAGFAMPFLGKA
ncbi:unnamed protein product [Effrenium voratum]|uniref:Uncharacterized protein n=1 Tax=Effrenium voratum TaxID=2562239 RepID=A0AA36N289_9DINO|nr:unnamed protein product [Effrenium voratum]CAJ1442264.1 unnamed protein product [Effrenium voratum]